MIRRPMSVADLLAAFPTLGGGEAVSFAKTFLAHLSPTPWDQAFNEALPITLAGLAARSTVVQWPQAGQTNPARCALVDGIAMGVGNVTDMDNIIWAVTVDDQAVPGFDSLQGFFGVFVYPKPVCIPLLPGQRVKIVASNLTAVTIPFVTAYLMGRSFPTEAGEGS